MEYQLRDINPSMVSVVIAKIDPQKACRLDGMAAIILTLYAPELAPVLSKLVNECLVARFPAYWKSSPVLPVNEYLINRLISEKYRPIRFLPFFDSPRGSNQL